MPGKSPPTSISVCGAQPADPSPCFRLGFRSNFDANDLSIALNQQRQQAFGANHLAQHHVVPTRILLVFELDDDVAFDETGLCGGGTRFHISDGGRLRGASQFREVVHEQAGHQTDGQHDIHERPGCDNDQSLPAWLHVEAARVGSVGRLLASHLDIAAEGQPRDPEFSPPRPAT